jgi:Arc/MetJ family transcription regulator
MAEAVTNELMFEVLKKIQADVSIIKTTVSDHSRLLVRMREDDLRLEGMQVETQLRLDRIEQRVGLRDES